MDAVARLLLVGHQPPCADTPVCEARNVAYRAEEREDWSRNLQATIGR